MFVLNKDKNSITKINPKTFSELGFREREHLQEWIESNPESLGEELLFIQKEFGNFEDTRERLDLLALDKTGNLVVIENKLNDSVRDVTWQVLNYASYCSSLSKQQIKEIYQAYLNGKSEEAISEERIGDFLGAENWSKVRLNQDQRIILVAGSFCNEIISTVMWLINRYNMKIDCFKATPYFLGSDIILDVVKITPVSGAVHYTNLMAEKAQEESHAQTENMVSSYQREESVPIGFEGVYRERQRLCLDYWARLLKVINSRTKLFFDVYSTKYPYLVARTGLGGVGFNFDVANTYARAHVYISRGNSDENKYIFDRLYSYREEIEQEIPGIEWQRLDDKKACRIKVEITGVSLQNPDDWDPMIEFMVDSMLKIEHVFGPLIKRISKDIKKNGY